MKTNTLDFDAQALRDKILDLAMRGKLVPQDPNDEPASVLLEKIKAEKEELVKEKKIKKTKSLPAITDDEKLFDIPDSWEWVRFGDILKPELHQKPERNFIYIDIASVDNTINKITSLTKVDINKDKVASRARQVLNNEDILFSVVRPYLKNIAMVPDTSDYKIGSTGFYVLKPYQLIDRKYIFYLVLSKYVIKSMTRKMKGDNSPSIRKGDLQNLVVPLPPLSEQSRIAAKIAQLFALLRKVESFTQQYAELQTLLKSKVLDLAMRGKLVKQDPNDEPASVLVEKIKAEKAELVKEKKIKKSKPLSPITDEEKPFDIPDNWRWIRLGDVSKDIRYGYTASAQETGNSKLVRITDIQNGRVDWNTVPFCDVPDNKIKALQLLKDDILIARTGGTIGKSYKIKDIPTTAVFASYLIRIRFLLIGKENYTKYVMQSPLYWSFISKKQSGTGQPNVNATKLSEFIFPLPPLSEQSRIATKIANLFTLLQLED